MELLLNRETQTANATLGRLFWENTALYFTCEDMQRALKIPGETAIPCGRYRVVITYSNRFKKNLPLLLDVPNFEGIRIHSGNTSADTEGCILLGMKMGVNSVLESRAAMADFMPRLESALKTDKVFITIKSAL